MGGGGEFGTVEGRTTPPPLLEYFLPCAMSSKLIQVIPKNQMLRSDWRDAPSALHPPTNATHLDLFLVRAVPCRVDSISPKTHFYKKLILRLKFNLNGILRVIDQFSTKINTCMP